MRDKLTIFATGKVTGRIRYGKVVILRHHGFEEQGEAIREAAAGGQISQESRRMSLVISEVNVVLLNSITVTLQTAIA